MIFITREEKQALKQTYKMLELSKPTFALAVVAGTASIASSTALNALSAWLIAKASKMPPVLTLTLATVSVRMFGITKALFRYIERLLSHDNALQGINNLRENIYKKLASSPIDSVAHIKQGDLFSRASNDIEAIGNFVIKSILPLYIAIFSSLIPITITFFILPKAALTLTIGLFISGIIAPLFTIKATRLAQFSLEETQTILADNTMVIMESGSELIINNQDIKLFNILEKTENKIYKLQGKVAKLNAIATILDSIGLFFAIISAILLGIPAVVNGQIHDINLAIITLLPLASFESTSMLRPASIQLVTSARSAIRIIQLLENEKSENTESINIEDTNNLKIKLENLSTGWKNKTIIENLNFEITTKSKIAIVGESGIGKSTLLYTLAGMLDKTSGKLTLNNIEITTKNRQNLSKYVTLITEDSHIFQTSIYENIRVVDNKITEKQAYDYLAQAGLKEWIDSIPDGIHTQLNEGVKSISGGQRRRILLARCYASKTPFVLIDEPNEHLDVQTTDKLIEDIFNLSNDISKNTSNNDLSHTLNTLKTNTKTSNHKGIVVVTHRLTPLVKADLIIMLEKNVDGITHIKHMGSYDDLLEKSEKFTEIVRYESL